MLFFLLSLLSFPIVAYSCEYDEIPVFNKAIELLKMLPHDIQNAIRSDLYGDIFRDGNSHNTYVASKMLGKDIKIVHVSQEEYDQNKRLRVPPLYSIITTEQHNILPNALETSQPLRKALIQSKEINSGKIAPLGLCTKDINSVYSIEGLRSKKFSHIVMGDIIAFQREHQDDAICFLPSSGNSFYIKGTMVDSRKNMLLTLWVKKYYSCFGLCNEVDICHSKIGSVVPSAHKSYRISAIPGDFFSASYVDGHKGIILFGEDINSTTKKFSLIDVENEKREELGILENADDKKQWFGQLCFKPNEQDLYSYSLAAAVFDCLSRDYDEQTFEADRAEAKKVLQAFLKTPLTKQEGESDEQFKMRKNRYKFYLIHRTTTQQHGNIFKRLRDRYFQ